MANYAPEDYSLDRMRKYAQHFSPTHPMPTSKVSADLKNIVSVTEESRAERAKKAPEIASDYYDLVSLSYENGRGQRFHYTPLQPGKGIAESMVLYGNEFARLAGLKKGMRVLDLRCGVGCPARSIAEMVGCEVVGVTNCEWHVTRGRALTKEAGLEKQVSFVEESYMQLPFEDASFDAAYAFEALCYASDLSVVYKEVYRCLKPGGQFAFSDWTMTDKFDITQKEHIKIRNWLEYGNGIVKMPLVQEMRDGLKETGFEVYHEENFAYRSAPSPWYYGPAGNVCWEIDLKEFVKVFQMSPLYLAFFRLLPLLGIAPRELLNLMDTMRYCCRSVAIGGKMDIFTPMYMLASRKPGGETDGKGAEV